MNVEGIAPLLVNDSVHAGQNLPVLDDVQVFEFGGSPAHLGMVFNLRHGIFDLGVTFKLGIPAKVLVDVVPQFLQVRFC